MPSPSSGPLKLLSPHQQERLGAGSLRISSVPTGLGSASIAPPPPPPPTNTVCLCPPPHLRYFGPLASWLPASLPSCLPLEPSPHLSPLHSAPSEHLSRPLPACSGFCLQSFSISLLYLSLLARFSSLSLLQTSSPRFSLKPLLSLSLPLPSLLPLSPPFSLPISVCHILLPLLLLIPLPCSLHSCPGLTPPAGEN